MSTVIGNLMEHMACNILTTEDARYIDQEVPKQLGCLLETHVMKMLDVASWDALWREYDLFSRIMAVPSNVLCSIYLWYG